MRTDRFRIRAIGSMHFVAMNVNPLLKNDALPIECRRYVTFEKNMFRTYGSRDSISSISTD